MGSADDKRRILKPERRTFAAGTTIFKEGDQADCAYIVESGEVQIFKMINERRVQIGTIHTWGIFGELGLIDASPRMAAAYATKDSVCMVVTKSAVGHMMDGAPQGLNTLIHSLVQIIRTAGQDLAEARYQLLESQKAK
jgi:CRP-like cAMP-binding protein